MRRFLLTGVAALVLTGCTVNDVEAPSQGGALARVAERLASSGDVATAAAIYRSAIALGQNNPEVRRGFGNALLSLGEPKAAIEQFEAALLQTKDARLYNGLGVAYDMMGDHAHAQEMFRTGLALEPDYRALIHNYGLSLAAAAAPDKPAPQAAAEPERPMAAKPASAVSEAAPEGEPMRAPDAEPLRARAPKAVPVAANVPAPTPIERLPVSSTPSERAPITITPVAFTPVAMNTPAPPPAAPVPVSAPAPTPMSEPIAPRVNEIVPLGQPLTAAPLHGAYYRFRLAGYATREGAMESWRDLMHRSPELKGAVEVVAQRTSIGPRAGLRYELVSAPLPSLRAAETACDALNERGLACRAEPASSALTVVSL